MPKLKFTKSNIDGLQYAGRQETYWDTETAGFVLSVNRKCKTFSASSTVHGKPVWTKIGRYDPYTIDEARLRARELLLDMSKGINPNEVKKAARREAEAKTQREKDEKRQEVTFRQALEAYMAEKRLRPSTAQDYRYTVETRFADWLDRPIQSITKAEVTTRHRSIQKDVAAKRKDPARGESVANGAFRIFRAIYNFAVMRFELTNASNPVRALSEHRLWFKDKRRQQVVPPEHLPEWIKAVRALPDTCAPVPATGWPSPYAELRRLRAEMVRDYLLLMLFTGLRKSETASLTWDAFDFIAKKLTVPGESTKNGRTLVIPLPEYVAEFMLRRKEQRAGLLAKYGALTHPRNLDYFDKQVKAGKLKSLDQYVFLWLPVPHRAPPQMRSKIGTQTPSKTEWKHERLPYLDLSSDYLVAVTDLIEANCGAKVPFTSHDLRRTFITFANSLDISSYSIKRLINHSMGDDVTAGYINFNFEKLRQPMTKIEQGLLACAGLTPKADVIDFDARKQAHAAA